MFIVKFTQIISFFYLLRIFKNLIAWEIKDNKEEKNKIKQFKPICNSLKNLFYLTTVDSPIHTDNLKSLN